jgi:hypothetical protein
MRGIPHADTGKPHLYPKHIRPQWRETISDKMFYELLEAVPQQDWENQRRYNISK